MNKFEKYYIIKDEKFNTEAFDLADEAFRLFKELYDTYYGSIYEDENLISIHTGGWSDNEELIEEFKLTSWWFRFHEISRKGGHYYFDTNYDAEKKWCVVKEKL